MPVWRTFARVTLPVCLPAVLDIAMYLFVNAMTTVSAVVFLYSPHTTLAAIAVLNMDDAGDVAPAAAMAMVIFVTSAVIRAAYMLITQAFPLRDRRRGGRDEPNRGQLRPRRRRRGHLRAGACAGGRAARPARSS